MKRHACPFIKAQNNHTFRCKITTMNCYIIACRIGVEDKVKKHLDRFLRIRSVVVVFLFEDDRPIGKPL